MIPIPLLQAPPTEFLTAQTTNHVVTARTFFYWVVAKWTILDIYSCDQRITLAVYNRFRIPFISLSKDASLITCCRPVGIFLALEAPHGTTDTYHWDRLDSTKRSEMPP